MHILIGLVVAVILVAIAARRGKASRGCRWRADSAGDRGALRKYMCIACGAEAFTASKGPPNTCKDSTRTKSL